MASENVYLLFCLKMSERGFSTSSRNYFFGDVKTSVTPPWVVSCPQKHPRKVRKASVINKCSCADEIAVFEEGTSTTIRPVTLRYSMNRLQR